VSQENQVVLTEEEVNMLLWCVATGVRESVMDLEKVGRLLNKFEQAFPGSLDRHNVNPFGRQNA
jgi:hypothetical protein